MGPGPPPVWTWPGLQDGLGRGGLRLNWAKGRFCSKKYEKIKVLQIEFSIVEKLSGPQESIFLGYLEAPNSILVRKPKIGRIILNLPIFP